MSIEVDDESYHYSEIMGRDDVTLYFSLAEYIDIPLGCYVEYMAKQYTLYSVDKMRMQHRRDYEYTITFESEAAELDNYIYTNPNDGRFKFPLAAKPQEHLSLLCLCMTRKTGVTWTASNHIEGTDKLISYDSMTCLDALKQIADAYETEYRIDGTTIHLGKVEFYTTLEQQVPISYGKGNGMRPGVEKTVDDSEKVIGRVYIQGGDRNIDYSHYQSATLLLPKDTHIWYDGSNFYTSAHSGATDFVTSSDGRYVRLAGSNVPAAEGALDLTDVYPSYEHTVSSAVEVDAENNFWDIYADNLWNGTTGINYQDCLIANDADMTIIFQSGALVGREFGAKFKTETVEGVTTSHLELVPANQDGLPMPNRANGFFPAAGDKFKVFNIYLPDEYIESAETEMLHQAVIYLYDHCEQRFSIKGEIDPIWSASRWGEIGGHFRPGAYFRFSDPTWETDGISIRITNVKTFINKPHMPIVELSNSVGRQGVSTALKKVEAEAAVLPESAKRDSIAFTKRSFRDAQETMSALAEAMLEGFTDHISPITVQTMQMLVGDEALQFRFWTNRSCVEPVTNPFVYDTTNKKLTWQACALQHMTLGINDIKPSSARTIDEYLRWNIIGDESAVLEDGTKRYYVYAKCDKLNNGTNHLAGTIILSEKAKPMDGDTSKDEHGNQIIADAGYYFFLCGILNSEREGSRSFAPVFGYTEILPGQITTDVIRNSDGTSYMDLVSNVFNLGDKLSYNVNNSGELILRGTLVQTGSGATTNISAWCGQYTATRRYQKGDEVWYQDPTSEAVSTYRYKSDTIHDPDTPSSVHDPTNSDYWEATSVGAEGGSGQGVFKSIVFLRSATTPSTPSGGTYLSPVPSGWSDGVPSGTEILWMSTRVFTSDGQAPQESAWTAPQRATSGDEVEYRWSSNSSKPAAPGNESGGNLSWTASTDVSWIHLNSTSGSGAATLRYTVDSNSSTSGTAARTGRITISYTGGSKTFTVTQDGTSAATGSISPTSVSQFSASGGSQEFTITDSSSAGWTLTKSDLDWVTLSASSGTGSGNVTATIPQYSGASSRSGSLTFVCGSTSITITISQAAAQASTNVSASLSSSSIPTTATTVLLTINDPDNHGWTYGYSDYYVWGMYVDSEPEYVSGSGTMTSSSADGATGIGSVVLRLSFTSGTSDLYYGYVRDTTTNVYTSLSLTRS